MSYKKSVSVTYFAAATSPAPNLPDIGNVTTGVPRVSPPIFAKQNRTLANHAARRWSPPMTLAVLLSLAALAAFAQAPPTPAASGPASLERGKQLLDAAQQAAGGAAKLEAVKDFVQTAELDAVNPRIQVKRTMKWVAPNYLREENSFPGAEVSLYTDGKTGWLASGSNSQALGGPQAKQANGDLFRSYIVLLLSDKIEGRTVNAVDANAVEIVDKTGNLVRLTIDPATHLIKSLRYDAISVTGAPPIVQETYSDFRDVSGIKVPFKIALTQNSEPYADLTVSDFKINAGLTLSALQKRP